MLNRIHKLRLWDRIGIGLLIFGVSWLIATGVLLSLSSETEMRIRGKFAFEAFLLLVGGTLVRVLIPELFRPLRFGKKKNS